MQPFCTTFDVFTWEGRLAGFPRSRFFQPGSFYAEWLYINWAQFNLAGAPLFRDKFSNITNISYGLTALFTNMRILKFKNQLTIALFAAVNHLNGPLRIQQNFTLPGSKGQGSLLVIVIMIDGSEKQNCEGGFWTLDFACLWKAQ